MNLISPLKDLYSETELLLRTGFGSKGRNSDTIRELREVGYSVEPGFLVADVCAELRNEIDAFLEDDKINVWRDDVDSDKRIYGFESVSAVLHKHINTRDLKAIGDTYLGKPITHYFVLAARLDAVENNPGSGGGWHRDSAFSHQFKTIVYLSDVGEENGPFQYVPASASTWDKWSTFRGFDLAQTRFEHEAVVDRAAEIETLTGSAGDAVFADTRGMHRGKPIESGRRYAITYYFFTGKAPTHFGQLLQDSVSVL